MTDQGLEFTGEYDATQRNFDRLGPAVFAPVPQARVYNSANLSIASGAFSVLTFNTESYDEGDCHSTSSNTSALFAPVAGIYQINGQFLFDSTGGGSRTCKLRVNGATDIAFGGPFGFTYATAVNQPITVGTQYRMSAGDYVEMLAFQDSGAAKNVVASGVASPTLMFVRLAGFTAQVFD